MLIHAFCKICEHEIALQECKLNKLSYCLGKIEKNVDLSSIYLAVIIKGFDIKIEKIN